MAVTGQNFTKLVSASRILGTPHVPDVCISLQNFVHAPCTGCVYLTAEFWARPTCRMCVSHCRILCTPHVPDVHTSLQNFGYAPRAGCVYLTAEFWARPHVPDVCISLQNFVHAPCTGCVYLTAEFCARPMYGCISLQNFGHAPCAGCVYLTRDNVCEMQTRLAFHPRPSITKPYATRIFTQFTAAARH